MAETAAERKERLKKEAKERLAKRIAAQKKEMAERDISHMFKPKKSTPSVSVETNPTKETYEGVTQQKTPKSQKPKSLLEKIEERNRKIKGI